MKLKNLIIIGLVLLFGGAAVYSLGGFLSPYVPFREARETKSYVQVIGSLERGTPLRHYEGYFVFVLKDKQNETMSVIYRGSKPLNFEHTSQVVAIGVYNSEKKVFEADRLLVKCPSKYEEKAKKTGIKN
mgnify:CR=1 FL=1